MAVAQVIGRAGQLKGIETGHVQQLFGAGTHPHDAPVLGLQKFAVMQGRLSAFKEQADVLGVTAKATQTAFAPGFEVEV